MAMQRWMDANFGSVAAMYEDRHQLWGFNHKGRLLQRTLPARRAQVLTAFFSGTHSKLMQARLKSRCFAGMLSRSHHIEAVAAKNGCMSQ